MPDFFFCFKHLVFTETDNVHIFCSDVHCPGSRSVRPSSRRAAALASCFWSAKKPALRYRQNRGGAVCGNEVWTAPNQSETSTEGVHTPHPLTTPFLEILGRASACRSSVSFLPTRQAFEKSRWSTDHTPPSACYALPSDFSGAHTSNGSPVRSNSAGSSFSGLFTRVEMDHIVIGSDG